MMRRRGERKAGKSHQRRYVPLIVIAVAVFELYRIASMYYSMTRRDPIPRAFERYGSDLALSCVPPGDRWYGESAQETPIKRGLFFVNLLKTGSSTAAGIHLRISKNLARRLHQGEEHKWPICSSRFRNGLASFMEYGSRK